MLDHLEYREFGEIADRLLSFKEVMQRMDYPKSAYTFKRRVEEIVREFGGPIPPERGYFYYGQLKHLMEMFCALERIKQENRRSGCLKGRKGPSNV